MIKVGLTGGIGSGKTMVCNIFKHLKIPVFHADIVAKELYDSDGEIRECLIKLFGADIYIQNKLDRKSLSAIIFKDKEALKRVNAIVHPVVIDNFINWMNEQKNASYIIHEAAILFESDNQHLFDKVITVIAPEDIRIERVMRRDNVSETHVKSIINNQLPEKLKIDGSDYVIVNDDRTLVLPQVLNIHNELLKN